MHCENYLCKLIKCYCDCNCCELAARAESAIALESTPQPCSTCGTCPTCGRGPTPPVYQPSWYELGWYCTSCQMYHSYGYTCIKWNVIQNPLITYSFPYTFTYPQAIGIAPMDGTLNVMGVTGNTYAITGND